MHSIYLAELAATLSFQTPLLRHAGASLSETSMTAYWAATRTRLELWDRCLSRHRDAVSAAQPAAIRYWWVRHHGVLEEIMAGELLCRVVAALSSVLDRQQHGEQSDDQHWSPVAETVYRSHLDVSNRVARLMLGHGGHTVGEAVRFNRLRIAVARWSDNLIGQMLLPGDPELSFAADPNRAKEVAQENELRSTSGEPKTAAEVMANALTRAAMIDTLRRRMASQPALPQSTESVAQAVLLMMQARWFSRDGLLLRHAGALAQEPS